MARFSDLPDGVFEEIMSWLPPESLMHFKFVQKSWHLQIKALMERRAFVAKHLCNMKKQMLTAQHYHFSFLKTVEPHQRAQEEKQERVKDKDHENEAEDEDEDEVIVRTLLVLANGHFSGEDYIFCDTDDMRKLSRYMHRDMDRYRFKLASQCNGIVCLFDYDECMVYLMNPAIRELKIVHCTCYCGDYELRGAGFGYDSRSDQYKVVAVMAFPTTEYKDGSFKAKVYSLTTNSWRGVKCNIDTNKFKHENEQVYCNGVCYWYYWEWVMVLHSFDFSDEVFRDVPLPADLREADCWEYLAQWTKLAVWKETLVLLVYPEEEGPKNIDMWVLNSKLSSVGGSYSYTWTKHVTIGPLDGIYSVLGFWDEFELVLETEDGKIKFYHLGYELLSHLTWDLEWFCNDHFVIYEKSLVSVLRKEGRTSVVEPV